MIDFIGRLFSPIVDLLSWILKLFHYDVGTPWWVSIVLLTVVVRTLMLPLTIKQVRSMRGMQELKPELDKIRSKYKGNRQRQQQEQMNLYKERGINPLGGCLPLLVQMPIFIGIFYVIRDLGGFSGALGGGGATEASEPSFTEGGILWFSDLSSADSTLLLPILAAVTMLASMEVTNKVMEPQQRWLMRALPVGFAFFTYWFPAGMFVYWITSNVVTLGQNYVIYNFGPGRRPDPAPSGSSGKSSRPEKATSGKKGDPAVSSNGHGTAEQNGDRELVESSGNSKARAKRKRRKKKK
jgi:YidC/Oxa1 family membrane protein insertase